MAVENIRRQPLSRITCYIAVTVLMLFSTPVFVYAEGETPPAEATTTTPIETETTPQSTPTTTETPPVPSETETTAPTPGPQEPTGADNNTYTLNPDTGLYENDKYTWDPVTKQTKPKTPPTYSYNPDTGRWDTTEYVYDAPSGKYVPNVTSTDTPPEGATITDNPTTTLDDGLASNSTPLSESLVQSAASALNSSSDSSNNTINANSTGNGLFDLFYNAAISNNLSSTAQSGDAIVEMNTLAGDAISGSATAMANIINMLQSSWNMAADAFTTFVGNLMGNMVGDLFLDPGSVGNVNASSDVSAKINTTENTAIDNNISLEAVSGNATVTKNTTAGDAQTGDATAIANLVNAINSSIAAQQSFMGVLNIFGNLNGDILLPQNLIDTLLAANAVGSLDTSQISNSSEILGNFNNNQTINNNINSSAVSGNSIVDHNTTAGNATTGDASTNVTVLNLTGRQVIGKDALLVFVNVLGKWTGIIVNAPTGSTSAALGSNITQNSSLEVTAEGNQVINNNIDVSARSGDASVTDNTTAGSATSGNARTAVNLLNINNSNFSLSDWFGVLFINVFGTWTGSFGVDTEAGTITLPTNTPSGEQQTATLPIEAIQAYHFTPQSNGTYRLDSADKNEATAALASAKVLGNTPPSSNEPTQQEKDAQKVQQSNWLLSLLGVGVAASLLGTERVLNRRGLNKAK
jgi:hypothetical protein